ncbi:MAG: hypothetical protein J6J66_02815 [Clostridia bacterium]|nr:hypothetical protein [Clostridia bacterium]
MLPINFKKRMQALLGAEADAFFLAMEKDPVRALRINRIKAKDTDAAALCPFPLTPLSYDADGYIFDEERIGHSPLHHGGGIYVQDPGAMSAVNALPLEKGMRVLDLCAAPGGKSAQLAAAIGEEGMLYSNEYVTARAKILVGNLERLGVTNAVVTSTDTSDCKKWFSAYFDAVVVDAPCSGEGMFRKNEAACDEWSEEGVKSCAERQASILENAAGCVRDGGYLLYSTCTFSTEENEQTVVRFLRAHPDYRLAEVNDALRLATADGIALANAEDIPLRLCRRFYPHISRGEGQFVALMQRKTDDMPRILYKDAALPPTKEEQRAIDDFIKKALRLPEDMHIRRVGDTLCALKKEQTVPPRAVFASGVCLGRVEKGRLVPHHQLFSALGDCFFRKATLSESEAMRYLHGEELGTDTEDGFCAVFYGPLSLGGGKVSAGRLKNHYPKGLRNP